MSTHTIAFITSVSYFGMFIGASAGGWFSDRFGRKKGLILVVTFFSSFSLLSSLAWNPEILGVFRFLTSLGIGATTIVASTYISEFFPSATKGKYQAICITIGICGIPAAGWVAKLVVPSASYGPAAGIPHMPIVIQIAWYFPLVADGKNSLIYVLATIVVAPMPKLVRNLKTPSISGFGRAVRLLRLAVYLSIRRGRYFFSADLQKTGRITEMAGHERKKRTSTPHSA